VTVVELVVAGLFALGGVRSLVKWFGSAFESTSPGDQAAFALHLTARVGMWFGFAAFFAGYAVVDEPQRLRWFVLVPLGLAAIQILTFEGCHGPNTSQDPWSRRSAVTPPTPGTRSPRRRRSRAPVS
jgi:hypothetical protein